MDIRVGIGYDSHRLAAGRKFILGGVEIPHELGLDGHSDADVLLHAVIDALLGASGKGNIGLMFPDSDPAYKGADSRGLLAEAWRRVRAEGWEISNLDCVVVAERPRINPHLPAIRASLSRLLGVAAERVSVKPKTNEKLGFEGRREGVSAQAAVLLIKP
ncbi:MAG: 2-C-methyl-D-erythritol 2,4-cyclodiphosphate synthase [Duodenibacillus sp.]|nr:2-C-methyl-D-erythritol 2,4-cyclodiphosphate synthase [Duodenibacillus sp.]